MANKKHPRFETETQEAEWWKKNQELIADRYEEARAMGKLGKGTVARVARERASQESGECSRGDMNSCISCGVPLGGNRAKEHVIPAWLQEVLEERYENLTRCIAEAVLESVVDQRQHVFDRFQQGHICDGCNRGWMSELEAQTAPLLKPLIQGERSPLQLDAREAFLISRWSVKTALVLSSIATGGSTGDLTSLRRLKDDPDRLPERWGVFIGVQSSRNRNFSYFDRRYWPSIPANRAMMRDSEMEEKSLKVSLQLRHVLLLAAYAPDFPFRFLLHAGLHVPLTVWPGEQVLHTYREPLTFRTPLDPLDILQAFHDTLAIIYI